MTPAQKAAERTARDPDVQEIPESAVSFVLDWQLRPGA